MKCHIYHSDNFVSNYPISTMVGHTYTDRGYEYNRFGSLDLLDSPRTSKVVKI